MSSPGGRIRVRATANGHQRDCSRMIRLQHVRCKPRPVTADLVKVPGLRRAVAGIVHQQRNQSALRIPRGQQGNTLIGRPIRDFSKATPPAVSQSPAVHGKPSFPVAQRQPAGTLLLQRLLDHLHQAIR